MNKILDIVTDISARKAVVQGEHRTKIILFYCRLIKAAREEFTEDNRPTLDAFLDDCHKEALGRA